MSASPPKDAIAIVGMAGRFPGAPDIDAFWRLLSEGRSAIRTLSDADLMGAGVPAEIFTRPDYVKAAPVLDGIRAFDAGFFGLSPREASVMDPAHRIFLELAWHAFEQAGYAALPEDGTTGVFATSGAPLYLAKNVQTHPDLVDAMGDFLVRHTGNDMNFLSTRVSYHMDLRGPSLNIQTACSSALVAVHLACQSLIKGDCDLALAGGATVLVPQMEGYLYRDGEILSPDGQCRPFDSQSAGTVFGSGAGAVVLKRLSDALDHGDTIHAVIRGGAMNNDGAAKAGYLAPGVDGQVRVIKAALADAGLDAGALSYVEAHGTGTLVGDPIEAEALISALGTGAKDQTCRIGSVKSNIGHLGEAAGIASLIKTVLALKHRQLPPTLGFRSLNPAIAFEGTRFSINANLNAWDSEGPLLCGVTALGAGGTNCHVILEEAPEPLAGEGARTETLFVLSAKTTTALNAAAHQLGHALAGDDTLDLADAAWTLATGRRTFVHRQCVIARSREEAVARLKGNDAAQTFTAHAPAKLPVVFLYPGGGAQYAGMAQGLYDSEPVFKAAIDDCLRLIDPQAARALKPVLFPPHARSAGADRQLERPSLTLPALFMVEYAMSRLFLHWGVKPDAMMGHSVGEYAAACLSGVMPLSDALKLVLTRGQLFEATEPGSMLGVALSESDLRARLPARVSIAAINAPGLTVASGPVHAIRALQTELEREDISVTPIRIDVAAHSALLDSILDQFRTTCRSIQFSPPARPFISNVTGDWIRPEEACDPDYWVRHLRSPVRFSDGLATLAKRGPCILVEMGPGCTLTMLAKAQDAPFAHAFNTMRHPQEATGDLAAALSAFGRIWTAGGEVDWQAFYQDQLRNRVPLPGYAFDHQDYWIEPRARAPLAEPSTLTKRADIGGWFHTLTFNEAPLIETPGTDVPERWLILSEAHAPARKLAAALDAKDVLIATHGSRLALDPADDMTLDFNQPEQFDALLDVCVAHRGAPDHIVFLCAPAPNRFSRPSLDQLCAQHLSHPLHLIKALGARAQRTRLSFVSHGLSGAAGGAIVPERALLLGPAFVSPREFPELDVRCIDLPKNALTRSAAVMTRLVRELMAPSASRFVALTDERRWHQTLAPLPLPDVDRSGAWLREGGVYVITGGLGGIGLDVAAHMARQKPVKLALMSRRPLPEGEEAGLIRSRRSPAHLYEKLSRIDALRAMGADVMVIACDVTDEASLAPALDRARATLGPINGVIHAAGVIDDAPMLSKSPEAIRRVLAPKLEGTRVLDKLITEDLDIFLLFSSVASFLGLPGQADYAAANAYIDAFAQARSRRAKGRTLVINWSAWRDTGMAEMQRQLQRLGADASHASAYGAFDGYRPQASGRIYSATFDPRLDWLFAEHKVKGGRALLPGTAFVEFARAAIADMTQSPAIELSDLLMLAPFQAGAETHQRLNIHVTPDAQSFSLSLSAGGDALDTALVTARARALAPMPARRINLKAISSRCHVRTAETADRFLDQAFMDFGPRWANMRNVSFGADEALIALELPAAFTSDLNTFGLHPALLDMATGGVQALIAGFDPAADFYVPVGYERVTVTGRMPARLLSHVRYEGDGGDGFARFDVTLCDEDGNVFADIAHFTMKRVDAASAILSASAPVKAVAKPDALDVLLAQGITPPEGTAALERALAQPDLVQTVISAVDVRLWLRQLDQASIAAADTSVAAEDGFDRPDLDANFAAPQTPVERRLAAIWAGLLGVRAVGRDDDFFALGGNSLAGVRLFAAIKKQFGVSLPMSVLFEAPTIARLAQRLGVSDDPRADDQANRPDASALVCVQAGQAHRRPVFCVHGGLGNVVGFKPLAAHLGEDQPFYGLQAQGVDGQSDPLDSIPDMARLYIRAIRTRQMQGPYILAGYSGGGVIAQEMVRQLREAGDDVSLLIMIDTLEPSQISRPITNADRARQILHANPKQIARAMKRRLQRAQARLAPAPAPLTPLELASRAVETAYLKAQTVHHPARVACDVLLVKANQARMHFLRAGPLLGWGAWIQGRFDVIEVNANHETVCFEPAVVHVAKHIRARLDALDTAPRSGLDQITSQVFHRAS